MDPERIEIENEILEKLRGKIFLLQDFTHKHDAIFQVFLQVYNDSPRCQKFIRKSRGLELESFFKEFFSYHIIEEFLNDPDVEDILINHLSPIHVRKTRAGMVKTDKSFTSLEELELFVKKLIIFSGRKSARKINNVELSDIKGRANIVYSPFGIQVSITRAKESPLSIIDLIQNGCLTSQIAAQLWLYVESLNIKPANIIIAGGPGAGKTTLLNALLSFIPELQRLVVIEDTLELNTNLIENCARLESDEDVSLADLVKNALRMRPDRIIVGEVRGSEAQDLMTAMNIGKYCMGTLHASTARETIMRLENEPMNVPQALINCVDVFVIMRRYTIAGRHQRVVAELVETAGMEKNMVLLSCLWSYDMGSAKFMESAVSSMYQDRLAQISGKTSKEITEEIKARANFLQILLERQMKNFAQVTDILRLFTNNRPEAMQKLGLA